jgi:hypothetical protein
MHQNCQESTAVIVANLLNELIQLNTLDTKEAPNDVVCIKPRSAMLDSWFQILKAIIGPPVIV